MFLLHAHGLAAVILPNVNFMYTGTPKFQYTMYVRLLKTAHFRNMVTQRYRSQAQAERVVTIFQGAQSGKPADDRQADCRQTSNKIFQGAACISLL